MNAPLTEKILKDLGFIREKRIDDDDEAYFVWYKDFDLFEDWEGKSFSFATLTREDGSFKSGYTIADEQQLKDLYKALTRKEL